MIASPSGHGIVDERTFLGSLTRLRVTLDDGATLLVDAASRRDLPEPGMRVSLRVVGEDALVGGDPGTLLSLEELDPELVGPAAGAPPDDRLRDGLI